MDGHSTARRGLAALSHPRRNGMLKLLARERTCSLFRGQEEEHRDIHEDLFGQLVQQLSARGLPWRAVHPLKVRVDNAQANGHWFVPTAIKLCLRVRTFIGCQEVQNLLDLPMPSAGGLAWSSAPLISSTLAVILSRSGSGL